MVQSTRIPPSVTTNITHPSPETSTPAQARPSISGHRAHTAPTPHFNRSDQASNIVSFNTFAPAYSGVDYNFGTPGQVFGATNPELIMQQPQFPMPDLSLAPTYMPFTQEDSAEAIPFHGTCRSKSTATDSAYWS